MTDAAAIAGEETGFGRTGRWLGLALGPALAIGLQFMAPPDGLSLEAWRVVSLAALMVVWWVTEAIPISATALLPLAALPLIGAASIREASAPYADRVPLHWRLHARSLCRALAPA
jgi:sodium-dependent dicarboxylate transporter 2/3/5